MDTHSTAYNIEILMVLLLVASAVGLAVRFIKLPYAIALVIVGLLLGSSHLLNGVAMEPDIVLFVFLPALLFEASWNLDLRQLKINWWPIFLLAGPGVVLSTVVSAAIVHQFGGIALEPALLFGAMVAATDPISVLAVIRRLGCAKRLSLLLEAESLFNDGTAVVLFKLMLVAVLSATAVNGTGTNIGFGTGIAAGQFDLLACASQFLWAIAGGAAIGSMVGYLGSHATRFFEDHLLEITLTTIVAYGSYLLAEKLHVSPVIAVLMAGIVLGNYGSRTHMSATTRLAVNSFWEYAAFLVNSLVFLLMGLQIHISLLAKYSTLIFIGIFAVLVARAVVVYLLGIFLSPGDKNLAIPFAWKHLLFWGALRGSLSMAMALSLPLTMGEMRESLIVLTFGVVLFTLLLPGLTCEPLVKFLKLVVENKNLASYEKLRSQLFAEHQALALLETLKSENAIADHVYDHLQAEVTLSCRQLAAQIESLNLNDTSKEAVQIETTRKQLLEARKDSLLSLVKHHGAERVAIDQLVAEIDSKLKE